MAHSNFKARPSLLVNLSQIDSNDRSQTWVTKSRIFHHRTSTFQYHWNTSIGTASQAFRCLAWQQVCLQALDKARTINLLRPMLYRTPCPQPIQQHSTQPHPTRFQLLTKTRGTRLHRFRRIPTRPGLIRTRHPTQAPRLQRDNSKDKELRSQHQTQSRRVQSLSHWELASARR